MYWLNKIVWFCLNPVTLTVVIAALGAALIAKRRIRLGAALVALALAALFFASTVSCVALVGLPLERPYLAAQRVEALPHADAIVVLGGGLGKCHSLAYPDLFDAGDRVWHAARLWKAGLAPIILLSGNNDRETSVPFLLDLGVPRSAIVVDNESRNTYENSRFTERLLGNDHKVLLVTSAWHMTRALGNFSRTSLVAYPAPCDFSAHNARLGVSHPWDWFVPSADCLARTNYYLKEYLGRLARK